MTDDTLAMPAPITVKSGRPKHGTELPPSAFSCLTQEELVKQLIAQLPALRGLSAKLRGSKHRRTVEDDLFTTTLILRELATRAPYRSTFSAGELLNPRQGR